jgi:hypothetical protein
MTDKTEYFKRWYALNKEKHARKCRAYVAKNKRAIKAYRKKYYRENKQYISELNRNTRYAKTDYIIRILDNDTLEIGKPLTRGGKTIEPGTFKRTVI